MTTPTIHPIVLEKLQRFSRQRRRLIVWRGVCGTLALWCATMITVALLDRFGLLPDGLRWSLSLAGDVATGLMFWIGCGRQLTHRPDARELARLVELAAPQLREELLSAVELAEGEQQPHWDSDEFRAALQQATARAVGTMHVEGLLTRKLIVGWIYAVVAAGGMLLVLLGIPGLRFRQSFARAIAPAANLARYSSVQISVTAPTPPDQIAPEGDSLPVTVTVTGADVQQVMLEIFPHHGPRERTPMLLSAVNQFTAAIQLNQEPVQFRIRAQDAITRKYTLTPRPRPHVVRFQKTYHFPAYAQLPAKTVTEENGDLDALEGTAVELHLDVDQPIKEAALQLENKKLPLEPAGTNRLIAHVPLTGSGIYQVHLVAAQTGFENKYSPQYEIRVRPDLIPFAKIDKPEQDELVLAPDSVVSLAGSAKDDLALARVEQLIQVNRGTWQTVLLAQTTNAEIKVARAWDLFELGVHPGDRILTKLVATDRKGQRGESAPVRIQIATAGFDPDRLTALKERQMLDQSIHDFRETADQLDSKTRDARAIVNNPAADLLQKKQTLLAAATAADLAEHKAEEVVRQIKDALPRTTRDRDAADLALIGTAISRAQREDVDSIKAALTRATEHINTGDDKASKNDLDKILDPLATGSALARVADDTDRQLLAAAEATAASRDLQQLAAEQGAALTDGAQLDRTVRRQSVIVAETKSIEAQLKTLGEQAGSAANLARNLAGNRENLEKALGTEPSVETLKAPAEQLQHSVENAANSLRNTGRDLDQRAEAARKYLQDLTGTAADAVAKITAKPDSWQAAAAQLQDRAALDERRPHPDAPFIAAVGKTADAVQALPEVASTNAMATAKTIEAALRKLEAGHAIDEQVAALQQLAAQEHWEKPATPADVIDRVNDWKSMQQQLQSLPQQLARAQLPAEANRAVEAVVKSPAAQLVNHEMTQRQATPAAGNNVAEPLAKLAADLAQTKQQLQPALEQARAEIEKRAPAMSDRLAGLAHAAEKLGAGTTAQAQQAAKPENANQVRAAAQNLAATQQRLDNRIDAVKDALRRDANAQNLGTDAGRARARDADDATALLRQPTPSASELLQDAVVAAQPEQDLQAAATQQAKLADDLQLLAAHYQATEAGSPAATRAALREAEKELGLKPTLDAEYAKAQALEKLAGLTPQEQLAELESALPNHKPMRRELSDIAKVTLQSAAADLQKAADKERQLAQQPVLEQAKQIAAAAQNLARQDVPAVARQSGEIAKSELDAAGQKLESVAQNLPRDYASTPDQLVRQIQDQAAPLQQAASTLNNAAAKLGQAAQAAQQKVDAAKGNNANAAVVKQAETAQKQVQAAAQQARQASQQAGQLAQQAGQLAEALNEAKPQLQAVAQQPGIADTVQAAGNAVARAGRHEARLGQTEVGRELQQLGQRIENQTGAQVAQATAAMVKANSAAQVQLAAQAAHDAIQAPLNDLSQSAQQPVPAPDSAAQPQEAPSQLATAPTAAAQWLARALDSLDAAVNPAAQSPAGQPADPAQNAATQAATAAAQVQAGSMRMARSHGLAPGESPVPAGASAGGGLTGRPSGHEPAPLPAANLTGGNWGKLPPKLARDLIDSQREGVGGQYREMVEMYFRALADKARENQP